jgi:hypothetical protein
MRATALVVMLMLMPMGFGCAEHPRAGMSAAHIHVIAEPRNGVKTYFVHVPVYDAAPKQSVGSGDFERVDYQNLSDIIVWLEPEKSAPRITPRARTIGFNAAKPSSDVNAASVGQTLRFRNAGPVKVSIYSVSEGNEFSFDPIAPGRSVDYTPQSEGLIEILSDPSKPPIAQVYVAPSPDVIRVKSGDSIRFSNLPPGQYKAVAWHPRLPGTSTSLKLEPDKTTHAYLRIGVNAIGSQR